LAAFLAFRFFFAFFTGAGASAGMAGASMSGAAAAFFIAMTSTPQEIVTMAI
jgi:hypothetical protein